VVSEKESLTRTELVYIFLGLYRDCTSSEWSVGTEIKDLFGQNRHLLKEEIVLLGLVNEASMTTV
jgi:hypothetical protein